MQGDLWEVPVFHTYRSCRASWFPLPHRPGPSYTPSLGHHICRSLISGQSSEVRSADRLRSPRRAVCPQGDPGPSPCACERSLCGGGAVVNGGLHGSSRGVLSPDMAPCHLGAFADVVPHLECVRQRVSSCDFESPPPCSAPAHFRVATYVPLVPKSST